MVGTLRTQGLLHPVEDASMRPNGNVFAIPKSSDKASLIVNMVPFNRATQGKPPSFHLPSGEVLALLMQVQASRSHAAKVPLNSTCVSRVQFFLVP